MKTICWLALVMVTILGSARGDVEFLWGVSGVSGQPSTLFAINPANGQLIATVGATGFVNVTGLEIQPGTRKLLAVQGQLNPTALTPKNLLSLDKNTGVGTVVGVMGPTYAISDVAMRADGTLFGFGIASLKRLLTVSTTTAVVTQIGAANNITNVSLTFGSDGTLYLARTNGLFTMNPATGASITGPAVISGATTQIDNFMATNASGQIYAGLRSGAGTTLYRLLPTGVTSLVGTVPGVALSGLTFDRAGTPSLSVSGKRKFKTKKKVVQLRGLATSVLPLTVTTKGFSAKAVAGAWTLPKLKLRKGKNQFVVQGTDGLGQQATPVTIVVVRR